MKDCFACKAVKSIDGSGSGPFCEVIAAYCDDVQFCALFPDGKKKPPKAEKPTNSIIEKIQKLFQLSTSPNMAEAASALNKAEELMSKYNLSYGEVSFIEKKGKLNGRKIFAWQKIILSAVCHANNCVTGCSHGTGIYFIGGREINVFLSNEMFNYLCATIERMAKNECKGKGHKYNNDFKTAAAYVLNDKLSNYADAVSWAVDREKEVSDIKEYLAEKRKIKNIKENNESAAGGYSFKESEAIKAGIEAGKNISLHKQTGIDSIKQIGA